MTAERQWLSCDINVASDAVDLRYLTVPAPGRWKLVSAYWVPATTLAAHATIYTVITLKKGITGGTVVTLGALSTASSGGATSTAGVPRAFTLAQSTDVEFTGGTDPLEITADGTASTGAVADGCVVCEFVKVHGA